MPLDSTKKSHKSDEVCHLLGFDWRQSTPREVKENEVAHVKPQHVREAVPMDRHRVGETDHVRTDLVKVIGEHTWECQVRSAISSLGQTIPQI